MVAAREVLESQDPWEEYSWADLERGPLEVALAANELPDGVYRTHSPYRINGFALSDPAKRDLEALERMLGRPVETVRFDAGDVEQARSLGAVPGDGSHEMIVGADVAAQLVGDQIARAVKEQRQREGEERREAQSSETLSQNRAGDGSAPVAERGRPTGRPRKPGGRSGRPSANGVSARRCSTWSLAAPCSRRSHACGSMRAC